jgi:hypothetical protein
MAAGVVHTTPGRDAVALWLPAGPGAPGYRQRLAAATAPWTGRFAVFDQALEDHHPADVPISTWRSWPCAPAARARAPAPRC